MQCQEETDQDEFSGPHLISKLEEVGISLGDIKKLQDAGYQTVEAVAFTAKKNIVVKGLTEAKIDKIVEAVLKLVPMEFQTAADFYEKRKQVTFLTTGSSELDRLLGGGIET